jgi:hypothetical protein
MWAYIDETGNTGNRIFDPEQPIFITAALMTRTNFDLTRSNSVGRIAKSLGVNALHANELGISRIEEIAPGLQKVLKAADARFFVARLEKRYLAAAKVFDTYFDQGENLAVAWHVYWLRPLRLALLFKLAHFVLTEDITQTVWNCVTASSEAKSKAYFVKGAGEILARVDSLPDARSRQIVAEAMQWALENPENFSTYLRDKVNRYGHSPNFVAFRNLMEGIHQTSKRWSRPVKEIVHDQQSQFEKTISQWHETFSRPDLVDAEPIQWPGESEPLTVSRVPGSIFKMATEETSAGLQVVDTALWLFKRMFDGKEFEQNSARLINWILRRAYQNDFSFAGVSQIAQDRLNEIMNADFNEKQLTEGSKMQESYEARRRQAMEDYANAKNTTYGPVK